MSREDDIVDRLDRLITLLTIVHGDAIGRLREQVMADPVDAAIMTEVRDDWVLSGELQRRVGTSAQVGERTVLRAIVDLSNRRLLISRGSGKNVSYRSSGIL
jgi:hypothetical protein